MDRVQMHQMRYGARSGTQLGVGKFQGGRAVPMRALWDAAAPRLAGLQMRQLWVAPSRRRTRVAWLQMQELRLSTSK